MLTSANSGWEVWKNWPEPSQRAKRSQNLPGRKENDGDAASPSVSCWPENFERIVGKTGHCSCVSLGRANFLFVRLPRSRHRSSYSGLRPVAQIQFLPDRCTVATSVNPAWVRRSRCSASLRNAARSSAMTMP
jgi:hypothetical protein